jgi:predicted ABC-type ATPase
MPVLTIFAGPNGSGKSTLRREIASSGYDLGTYINPDDIVTELRDGYRTRGLSCPEQDALERMAFHEAEARRAQCLDRNEDFSFETVFSHISKVEFIQQAKAKGFVVRLFFVSTENSRLNVERVRYRVAHGGHDVPVEKIIARYRRAMNHLPEACRYVDEAVLFDNSGRTMRPVVHFVRSDREPPHFEIKTPLPVWTKAFLLQMVEQLKEARNQ